MRAAMRRSHVPAVLAAFGVLAACALPVAAQAPKPAKASEAAEYRLAGTIIAPDIRRATLVAADGVARTVRPGDRLGEWTVSRIGERTVVLRSSTAEMTLDLRAPPRVQSAALPQLKESQQTTRVLRPTGNADDYQD